MGQKKGRQMFLPPSSPRMNLLQVGHCGQVSRELGDAGGPTPIRTKATRIDCGNVGRAKIGSAVITGEGVTIALREVGVGVAQIEGEHLVGKADTDVPGVVAGLRNAEGERSTKDG